MALDMYELREKGFTVDRSNAGRRVELTHCADQYIKLKPGDRGTYIACEATRLGDGVLIQHRIRWDSGSNLMLIEKDGFKFIDGS